MNDTTTAGVTRRRFLIGAGVAGAGALALGLHRLRERSPGSAWQPPPTSKLKTVQYGDYTDLWRERWTWDRVAKGTHTRANCIAACSWDVYVKDGIVWREEQNAVYESPRTDVPDGNPRGCQKGACYSDLQAASSRVLYPLVRVGERGAGQWKRITWDDALDRVADAIIDTAVAEGTESIIFDHGTTNSGYGPESSAEMRFAEAVQSTLIDSWAGVGDMPMGAVQTWGIYNCEGTSDDWFRSDYIVVWIGNPAYTRIPEVHFMHEARYRGAKLVVISPDYNATCVHADLWLNLKPESDAALGMAAAQVIVAEKLFKEDYVREQTDLPFLVREDTGRYLREADLRSGGLEDRLYVWDEAKRHIAVAPGCLGDGEDGRTLALGTLRPALTGRYTVEDAEGRAIEVRPVFERLRERLEEHAPEKVASLTGLSPTLIRRFARELAAAPAAMIFASWGACKHHHSDLFQRSMILLMALTGNQGKSGGGLRIAAWWGIDGLSRLTTHGELGIKEMLRVLPKAIRGLTPRDYEQLYTEHSQKSPIVPLMPFLYVHGGYRELWSRSDLIDPALPRDLATYMRESIDRGWIEMHPPESRSPKMFIFTGCNPLRRWPAPQHALEGLWPKLDLIVSVNFRMSESTRHADIVLPAAGYYEKHGIKYGQTYLPYLVFSDQAVKPLGESKSEWEIFGLLTECIARRARERGTGEVRGYRDRPLNLGRAHEVFTSDGRYDPKDPIKLIDDILRDSPSLGGVNAAQALQMGAVPIVGPARPGPEYHTSSDFNPKDTYWPHRWFVEDKVAWPTLSGRQQFYIDHPWYLEADEALPRHKDPPGAGSRFPLRINGGHTRWSIHAIWRDHELMLRLQRGEPVCFMSPADCAPRGIRDNDRVRIFNDTGSFESLAKLAPGVQPGEVIIYHAWEPFQFAGGKGCQGPVEAPWKPLHLAGGYAHLHYRMYYGAPSHSPRGTPIEVERVEVAA